MAAKFGKSSSGRALIALALPLAALVPVAVPFGAAEVASFGLPGAIAALGQADAATVRKAKRKGVVRGLVTTTTKVCTTTRTKGRKVTRCKAVRPAPVPPVLITPIEPLAPPPVTYIPPPPPMPTAPQYAAPPVSPIAYYWIDQADSYAQALGNSPPDFTFDCDGINCWAWVSRAGEVLIVEPGRNGVLQYFFAPQQSAPYLARDSYTSFAFDGRDVVQVYDGQGRVYTGGPTSQARYDGAALQQRGRALFAASLRQRRWDRGAATAWIGGYNSFGYDDGWNSGGNSGWNSGWSGAWRELPAWDRYDRDHRRQHPPRHLGDERRDRDDARRRYEDWHRRGDHGAPPPTGNPVVTPTDGSASAPPPRPPQPQPQPPQPQPQPPLPEPPPPVIDTPPPVPGDAPIPRRERPRREIEDEPGAPPHRSRPAPDQPVVQIQAQPSSPEPLQAAQPVQTWPEPMPGPAAPRPVLVESPDRTSEYAPAPAPDPAPIAAPAPETPAPPPAPAPPPPPHEQIITESRPSDTDRP